MMKELGIGYGAINHPIDRDPVCGFNGIINDECPCCGRTEDGVPFERIRPDHPDIWSGRWTGLTMRSGRKSVTA